MRASPNIQNELKNSEIQSITILESIAYAIPASKPHYVTF